MTPSTRQPGRIFSAVDERRAALLAAFGRAPFTTAQAVSAGLTHSDLRSHHVTPVMRGVYAAGAGRELDHGMRCAAAVLRVGQGALVGGVDAARLMGLPVPEHERPVVSVPRPLRGRAFGDIELIRRPADAQEWRLFVPSIAADLATTHPRDLLAECLPGLDLVDGVILVDALLLKARDPQRLLETMRATTTNRRIWRVLDLARAGAASPMETRLRLLLVLAGFPEPVLQHEVMVDGRRFVFDLAYPGQHLGIEYDGSYHFESEAQKQADIRREDLLHRIGWARIPVVSRGVLRDPASTLDQVAWHLEARGVRVHRSSEWTAHFAQRDPRQGYRVG